MATQKQKSKVTGWISSRVRPPYGKTVIGAILEKDGEISTEPVYLLLTDERGDLWQRVREQSCVIREKVPVISWYSVPEYNGEHSHKPKKK